MHIHVSHNYLYVHVSLYLKHELKEIILFLIKHHKVLIILYMNKEDWREVKVITGNE